jgi:hypothetical protein
MSKNQIRVQSLSLKILIGIFFLSFLLPVSQTPAFAASSFDLGMVGVGARAIGMGKAYVAVVDDTNAVFVNPAGLAVQDEWSATSMSTKLMDKVDYKMLGGAYKTDFGTFGVGYISANTPAGYLTTDKNSLAGATAISYGSSQLSLSYARSLSDMVKGSALGNLSVGVNLKLLRNDFNGYDASSNGQGIDLGFLLKPKSNLTFGACFKNITGSVKWKNGTDENIEGNTKLGGAVNLLDNKLLLTLDTEFSSGPVLLHSGAEYKINRFLALRAGLDQSAVDANNTATNLTAGIGLNMNGIYFDYAFRQDNQLADNSTHYFSISLKPEFVSTFVSDKQESKTATKVAKTETSTKTETVPEVKTEVKTEKATKTETENETETKKSVEVKNVKFIKIENADSEEEILNYYK